MREEEREQDLEISPTCTFCAMLIHRGVKWKPEIETCSSSVVEN